MLTPNSTLQHGRYRIIRPIGQGGMGAVYEAYDNHLNNRVALKEALVSDASLLRAFEREAQRLARLRHIALPRVIDHFMDGNGQYLVMDDRACIEGQDLREMLKQRGQPFPVAQVLAWANRLLDALAYLHQEGVEAPRYQACQYQTDAQRADYSARFWLGKRWRHTSNPRRT